MEDSNIDDQELSRHTFVPMPTISRLRNNPKSNPTISSLEPIAKFFDITIDQLIGKSELPKDRLSSSHVSSTYTYTKVPIINWSDIDNYLEQNNTNNIKAISWVSSDRELNNSSFGLIINSISFGILFRKNSLIIIEPSKELVEGDHILIKTKINNFPSIRTVIYDNDKFYSKSCNPEIKGLIELNNKSNVIGKIIETRYSYISENVSNKDYKNIKNLNEIQSTAGILEDALL